MSGFFGNMLIALRNEISSITSIAAANETTSTITASASGGRGTYTYNWQQSGITSTINDSTSASTTVTGSSTTGDTIIYCNITDTITGNTASTPICTISWTSIPITAMSFTLNGSAFTTNQTASSGTTYTIAVSSVIPAGATYSPSSTSVSTPGTYSLLTSGTGTYTGTFTSPTLTLNQPLSVSIPSSIASGGTTRQVISTTIVGGVPPYTLVSWTKISGSGTLSATSVNSATVNKQASNTNFICTVTIRDSVSTQVTSNTCTIFWNPV
jgi:hypothetical protein